MEFLAKKILLLFILTNNKFGHIDSLSNKYISLITDVHKYYGTSSVFFIFSSNDRRLQEYALIHVLCRDFSRQGVLTLMINFENLDRRTKFYRKQIVRPLVVVILKSVSDIVEFSSNIEGMKKSYPIWLVIFAGTSKNAICKYCSHPSGNIFDLQFNTEMLVVCCDNPMLKEWWSIHRNHTQMADFATWTEKTALTLLAPKGLYARRHDVNGTQLRIGIVRNSAFVLDCGDKICGFLGNLVDELSRVMNFKTKETRRENVFGSWSLRTERWTGVIGQLARREADLGVGEFAMTNPRLNVVDFTLPLLVSESRLYIRDPGGLGVQWSAYFKAFTIEIWMAIIVLIIITPVLLTLIKVWHNSIQSSYLLFEHYLHVWGVFCQQGLSEFPQETPLRIAYISVFSSALVVSAAYSASLISFLTVSSVSLPFSTMDGFANDGTYKLIVFRNSADYDFFATSTDRVLSKMMFLMKPYKDLPLTMEEAFEQVCRERVAFYSNEAMKKSIDIYLKCKVSSIASGRTNSLAMTVPADNQYTGVLNYHLHRFRDNGMLYRLKQQHFIKGNPAESSHHSVSLWGIAPILSVLSGGVILAFVIFFFEKIFNGLTNHTEGWRQRMNLQKFEMHRWPHFPTRNPTEIQKPQMPD